MTPLYGDVPATYAEAITEYLNLCRDYHFVPVDLPHLPDHLGVAGHQPCSHPLAATAGAGRRRH